MKPTYSFSKVVTIGDTNALQNVYFAEYFKIQGQVREMWLRDAVPNVLAHFAAGLVLSTKSAHCEYRRPFYPFDTIDCRMHIEDLQRVSARLVFEFYKSGGDVLHAFGWQQVVFKDANRKTCRMPEDFRTAAKAILWTGNPIAPPPEPN